MPKPDEFQVHTMSGGTSNATQDTSGAQSPQRGPSTPFTGAPVTESSGVQTMGGNELSGKSSGKLLKIFIGVFVGIILVGGAIFGIYFLKDKDYVKKYLPGDATEEVVEEELGINTEEEPSTTVEEEPVTTTPKTRYSSELLNYLSINTESESVLTDIQNELDIIRTSLPSQNFAEPITFIVTNQQNQPISFSDFTVYADMGLPSDVLMALDDRFEIYAYNDFSTGVRFGFRVDVKDMEALKTALDTNASAIPPASLIFFKNFVLNPDLELKFNDGSYKDYAVKYLNLNESNTNSVDYMVDDTRWVLGTSQKTLRAIVDKLDKISAESSESSTSTTTEDGSSNGMQDTNGSAESAAVQTGESSVDTNSTTQTDTGTAN